MDADPLITSPAFPDRTPGGKHERYVASPRFLKHHGLNLIRTRPQIWSRIARARARSSGPTSLAGVHLLEEYVGAEAIISPLKAVQDMLDYLVYSFTKSLRKGHPLGGRLRLEDWLWLLGRDDLVSTLSYKPTTHFGMHYLIGLAEALDCVVPEECYEFAGLPTPTFHIGDYKYRYKVTYKDSVFCMVCGEETGTCGHTSLERHTSEAEWMAKQWEEMGRKVHPVLDQPNTTDPLSEPPIPDFFAQPPSLSIEQAWPNGEPTVAEAADLIKKALAGSSYLNPERGIIHGNNPTPNA